MNDYVLPINKVKIYIKKNMFLLVSVLNFSKIYLLLWIAARMSDVMRDSFVVSQCIIPKTSQ